MFLQVALSHSEDILVQRKALQVGEDLITDAPEEYRQIVSESAKYARFHEEIVERFGRFPHRNALLGRESRPEELEFLKTFPGF